MPELHTEIRTLRGIQQSFMTPVMCEPSLPTEQRGAVYTKGWVVELLLDLAGYHSDLNLADAVAVEPSAGEGAFLLPMIERLLNSCERLGRNIWDCADSLIAFELDETSAERTRTLARALLIMRGVPRFFAEGLSVKWVRVGDYLLDSIAIKADYVIGNPPYVRLEEIPESTAALYRDSYLTMRGRADLYVAFFEAALHQLNDHGVCAFICADRWMRNQYGAELRRLITSSFSVDLVVEMHEANAFQDEVDAYPAITIIRRQKQGITTVARATAEVHAVPSSRLASVLLGSHKELDSLPKGLRSARVNSWFRGADPWPCTSPDQLALLRRLEDTFAPLEDNTRVGIGVATGNDSVFITKDANLVEPSRLLKLVLAKDIRQGKVLWSGHYLIDPWNEHGLVKLDTYPKLKAYFEKHRTALKKRHTAINRHEGWYKTIDRVTHELVAKPKLYIADIKERMNPVLDDCETYPHHNLYFIESEIWDLEILGGLLISAVGQFFIESYGVRMRGGYLRFQAQYLRRIRVPDPKTLSKNHKESLIRAFRSRDRELASETAMLVYGINGREKEILLEHR